MGATIPVAFGQTRCNVLIDTGAMKSCMSQTFYQQLMLPSMINIYTYQVKSATGSNLCPMGITGCEFKIGDRGYKTDFVVCKNLTRPCILGIDFLIKHNIFAGWTAEGKFKLISQQEFLVESLEVLMDGPMIYNKQGVTVPGRKLAVIKVSIEMDEAMDGQMFEVKPNFLLTSEHPNLVIMPMLHQVTGEKQEYIPLTLLNLAEDEAVYLKKGEILGHLEPCPITIEEIVKEDWSNSEESDGGSSELPLEKKFITSPAEVNTHRNVNLQDAQVSAKYREQFRQLCKEFEDIFSKDSTDIGKTSLITMDIDTGDSPPVCQKPYNLPLKHREWVQKELETLERARVIVRSISPWASPIVIVPKKTEPGEPPRRRLCVDYRVINSLLPEVQKAHSKAKGVLTLVPLPQIDHIYARLRGSKIFSTFDLRSGYHHMALSLEARAKSAFVTPMDKFEFTRCPFGLSQAPAYFQRLINKVIKGLPFAFGYLDNVLIHSQDIETHLQHVRIFFQRLREADLKLKDSKCNYFKTHVQYLGHLVSGKGIKPLPEKLDSIKKMPGPTTPKEIKQFLGLVGYYRKFIPRFADIARPMTNLTKQDIPFEWTIQCQAAFELLKEAIITSPILKYPDPNKGYTWFTDASKYAWACVLTQEYQYEKGGKEYKINYPITFASGLFKGSQMNWAALTKEAFAIYSSIKKLSYYLEDADIVLRSDHLPLKKFLQKNTLNSKVNNWAVEISPYRIKFEYIKGIKNTLANTMSRLIQIDPEARLQPEQEGYEFGYHAFEDMEPIEYETNVVDSTTLKDPIPLPGEEIKLPLEDEKLKELQQKDKLCKEIIEKLSKGQLQNGQPYYQEEGILKRFVEDGKQRFEAIVLPQVLSGAVLQLAHEGLGHNGSPRTYALIKRYYYWKGLKSMVRKHVQGCRLCQEHNKHVVKFSKMNFEAEPAPVRFISMDLIGEFHPPSSKGNRYALTVICMFTGYTFCIPIPNKMAKTVLKAYMDNVYCQFGRSIKILSDNGTEFKNKLMEEVSEELGVEYKIYSPPYRPQSNGRIESFHYFLKACIAKHIAPQLEWDDIVPLACAAYNFLPNEHSRESPFFLMFGRDPLLPLTKLLKPKIRYLGNDENILSLEALKNMYQLVVTNLRYAREKRQPKTYIEPKLKEGDLVLVKDHTAKLFQPRFKGNFRVITQKGNQVEVKPPNGGETTKYHVTDIKKILLADQAIAQLPDYNKLGRLTRLRLNPRDIPDLGWNPSAALK